jgi:hypothetical protein
VLKYSCNPTKKLGHIVPLSKLLNLNSKAKTLKME